MSDTRAAVWPELPTAAWRDTCATLHLWTQIVGKIRLSRSPWLNHSWHVTLYVNARGLTTSPIPDGARHFEIEFDFIDHSLRILASDGPRLLRRRRRAALFPDSLEHRPGVQAVPHCFSGQGEPGAFLLGQFRPRGNALFRPPRAAPSRRRAASRRRGRGRG